MVDDRFSEFDGTPKTGAIPVQVRAVRGTDLAAMQGRLKTCLQAFHGDLRAGSLKQLRRKMQYADGSTITLHHAFGTTTAYVYAPRDSRRESVFFGGIVLRPKVLPSLTAYRTNATDGAFSARSLPDEVKRSGAAPTRRGRPLLPGTPADLETDCLVLQVAPDARLTADASIRSGAVRIWRARGLKHGPVVELSNDRRYLLSLGASGTEGVLDTFYCGGARVPSLPPLPDTFSPLGDGLWAFRLCTHQFASGSLSSASTARGIVVLAAYGRLYAVDTAQDPPPAAWALLADTLFPADANSFGTELVTTERDGVITLTCAGRNGAGSCSSFEVRVRRQPGGTTTFEGELVISPRLATPAEPAISEQTASTTFSATAVYGGAVTTPVLVPVFDAFGAHTNTYTTSTTFELLARPYQRFTSLVSRARDAVPARRYDDFLGGAVPPISLPREIVQTHTLSETLTLVGTPIAVRGGLYCTSFGAAGVNSGGLIEYEIADPQPATYGGSGLYRKISAQYDYRLEVAGSVTVVGGITAPNGLSFSMTQLQTSSSYTPASDMFPDSEGTTYVPHLAPPRASGAGASLGLPLAVDYLARDYTYNALALTTVVEQSLEVQVPSSAAFDSATTGAYYSRTSPMRIPCKVRRPDDSTAHDFGDLIQQFPVVPASAVLPPSITNASNAVVPRRRWLDHTAVEGSTKDVLQTPLSAFPLAPTESKGAGSPWANPPEVAVYSAAFSGADLAVGGTFTRAAFNALFPGNRYADPTYRPGVTTLETGPFEIAGDWYLEPPAWTGASSSFDIRTEGDTLLRDARTGGFVAQVHWRANAGSVRHAVLLTVVGNNRGAVPLAAVLNEWFALGEGATPIDHAVIDDATIGLL